MTRPFASYKPVFSDLNYTDFPELLGPAESAEPSPADAEQSLQRSTFDRELVQQTFAVIANNGPSVMEEFYLRLFEANPDIRSLYPPTMNRLREHVLVVLTSVIDSLDDEPRCLELLARLGREHRKYGVTERHYHAFLAAMRETAKHRAGSAWTVEAEEAWLGALEYFSAVMRAAADEQAKDLPPWWVAEIVRHELRAPGVAVLKLAPSQPLPYQAGQYLPVQVTRWPRIWRTFSIANSPRPGGLIDLHVRAVPGGLVSNALAYHSTVGDSVLLGAPAGQMTLADSDRNLLCVAGGTGLAPIKAVIEQAIATSSASKPRHITLYLGARQQFDLYDLQDLELLQAVYPALEVIPVLSEEPSFNGLTGPLAEVVHARRSKVFTAAETYICGPEPMVSQAVELLGATIPAAQIHFDPVP